MDFNNFFDLGPMQYDGKNEKNTSNDFFSTFIFEN